MVVDTQKPWVIFIDSEEAFHKTQQPLPPSFGGFELGALCF
jgi:hypothetical protein